MADTKTSALTAIPALAGADVLPIVDATDTTTKKVSITQLDGRYATAAQGTLADAALPRVAGGASVENIGAVEENVQTVATTGATETLDTSVYGVFDMTMDQNCEFTFSNPAPSGKATSFVLILRGAFTPTLPASIDWAGGTPPAYTSPAVYTFTTVDGGTIWLGTQAGAGFA